MKQIFGLFLVLGALSFSIPSKAASLSEFVCCCTNVNACSTNIGTCGVGETETPLGISTLGVGTPGGYFYKLEADQKCAQIQASRQSGQRSNLNITDNKLILGDTSINRNAPPLQIKIPYFSGFSQRITVECEKDTDGNCQQIPCPPGPDGKPTNETCYQRYVRIPFLAEYLSAVIRFAFQIIGFIAIIVITYGGLVWLTARGDSGRLKDAKDIINHALLGLVMALSGYLILYLVNPALTQFPFLRIKYVERTELSLEDATTPEDVEEAPPSPGICGPGYVNQNWPKNQQSPMVEIGNHPGISGGTRLTTQHNLPGIIVAAAAMAEKNLMISGSGARGMNTQVQLVMSRCKWNEEKRNYDNCTVATASTPKMWLGAGKPNPEVTAQCTHINSLDLFARGSSCPSCPGIKTKEGRICYATSPCQQELIRQMVRQGFGVLMNVSGGICGKSFEPWHFNKRPESGFQKGATNDLTVIEGFFAQAKRSQETGYSCF